jgi:hypothetical protein
MWEGGEDESALEDTRKQFAAQQVPAQLRSSFQPELRREASGAKRPREPIQGTYPGKASGPPTIKTRESIRLVDGELCGTYIKGIFFEVQLTTPHLLLHSLLCKLGTCALVLEPKAFSYSFFVKGKKVILK